MSVRRGLVAAIGAGLMLTLGGGVASTATTTATPQLRKLFGATSGSAPPEICNLYQSPNNTRASICSAASFGWHEPGLVDGYYRGTITDTNNGYPQIRINTTVYTLEVLDADFRGIWTDASSVQFRVCGITGGCGPWK